VNDTIANVNHYQLRSWVHQSAADALASVSDSAAMIGLPLDDTRREFYRSAMVRGANELIATLKLQGVIRETY
jgi:hypothetical protein